MKESTKKYVGFVLVLLLGYIIGFSMGIFQTLDWIVDVAIAYTDYHNITLDLSEPSLRDFANKFYSLNN